MGVDDFIPDICWTQYFITAQGYNAKDNCLNHVKKSSIILEKNGKVSIIKITKHINIWYLFITDRFNNGEVSVVWCPIGDIIGDYTTKPLQGNMFRKFRDKTMGVITAAYPFPGNFKVEQLRKAYINMKSISPPGNDGTKGVFWGKLKVNWNNGYHPYHTQEAGTNTVT